MSNEGNIIEILEANEKVEIRLENEWVFQKGSRGYSLRHTYYINKDKEFGVDEMKKAVKAFMAKYKYLAKRCEDLNIDRLPIIEINK